MPDPTKSELLATDARTFDTETLKFEGLRGDASRHRTRAELENALAQLPRAPRDEGRVCLLLARGPGGSRELPEEVMLTREGGMPGDRWFGDERYGSEYQLATINQGFAEVVANGQDLALHGDNLFVDLDSSTENLPIGTLLAMGKAKLEVTPKPHNGCKKWAQRFGLPAMQLNLDPAFRARRLRGYYLRVVEDGRVAVGDTVRVLQRS